MLPYIARQLSMLTSLMVKKAVPQQKVVDSFIRIAQMMLCCGEEIESFVSGSRVFLFSRPMQEGWIILQTEF